MSGKRLVGLRRSAWLAPVCRLSACAGLLTGLTPAGWFAPAYGLLAGYGSLAAIVCFLPAAVNSYTDYKNPRFLFWLFRRQNMPVVLLVVEFAKRFCGGLPGWSVCFPGKQVDLFTPPARSKDKDCLPFRLFFWRRPAACGLAGSQAAACGKLATAGGSPVYGWRQAARRRLTRRRLTRRRQAAVAAPPPEEFGTDTLK